MITLGIETATTVVSVALGGDDGLLGSVEINRGRRHAEVLTPAIEFVCRYTQTAIGDIGAIAVDIGPGLFTGMRVGIATAKVIGQALQIPVVGVSSLDLLAFPFGGAKPGRAAAGPTATVDGARVIASVIDARKGEVFYAFYRSSANGVHRLTDPRASAIDDFNADVVARGQDVIAVGDGAWRYRDVLQPGVEVAELAHPGAAALVQLARGLALCAEIDGSAPDLQPMYLRPPDAQINWNSR